MTSPVRRRRIGATALGALLLLAFLAASVPPYVTLDPTTSVVQIHPTPQWAGVHYALVVAHVLTGSMALITVLPQLSSRLRSRRPGLHRRVGSFYVWAGIVPTSLLALVSLPLSAQQPLSQAGAVVWAVLTLVVTLVGVRAARMGAFGRHGRWMMRSAALATGVVTGRVALVAVLAIDPELVDGPVGDLAVFWIGWIVNLAVVEYMLYRQTARRRPASAPAAVRTRA